jgi:glutaconate CoA-transferase subunit B
MSSLPLEQRADMLAVLLARQIRDDSVVVMGTGTPLTAVSILLAISSHAPNANYNTPMAGGFSVVPHALSLLGIEREAMRHSVMRSTQIIDGWEIGTIVPRVAERFLQFFRPAQIDATGNINNSVIGDYAHPTVRLPGSVGISDMAAYYVRLNAYVTRHDRKVFRERVDFVSAPGTLGTAAERQARGLRWGRPHLVFTDLAVLGFDQDGRMEVVSVHPGVSLDDVRAATGFELGVRSAAETEPPSEAELATLRRVDPTGLRQLELVDSRARRALIQAALDEAKEVARVGA